jgi:hypothetical protein
MATDKRLPHSKNDVDDARVAVERLRLLVGLWRARNAADNLGELAITRNLEMLIALTTDAPGASLSPGDSERCAA